MKKLLCFLSFHAYPLGNAKCIWCGYEKKCPKHNEVLYIHGWEADEDCQSCKKEFYDWQSKREDYLNGD